MSKLSPEELAGRLAGRLNLSRRKAAAFLETLGQVALDALLDGDEVDLAGLVSIYVQDAPPRVRRERATGRKEVLPPRRQPRAVVSRKLREKVANESRYRGAGIVLAGGDDRFSAELEKRLEDRGVRCYLAGSLREGLKKAGRVKNVDFLVVAPSVPEEVYDRAVLELKARKTTAFMPVLRGLFDRSRIERPRGFKIIPDGVFSSPAELSRQVLGELERWREEKHYFKRQVRVRSASDPETVDRLVEALRRIARGVFRDPVENEKFLNAFPEAIENAAYHGNQSSPEKYMDIEWIEDSNRVMITVKDEGPGFDYWHALQTAAGDAAEVVRKHMKAGKTTGGLGVKLMVAAFDRTEYRDNGSRIVLVKSKG